MTPVFGSDPPAPPDVCFTCILPDTAIDRFRADPASFPYVVFVAPPDVCFTCILPDTTIDRFRADPASFPYVVFVAKLQILSSAQKQYRLRGNKS